MTATSRRSPRSDGEATKIRLKAAAQRLFATRGIDGVSVQEIVAAAGQRNNASLNYHFGGKEGLIKALIVEGARFVDEARQLRLETLESEGGPKSLRDIVEALALPVLEIVSPDGTRDLTYLRFIASIQLNHRQLLRDSLENRWNLGYRRCLDHIRKNANNWLPHLPLPIVEQRMSIVGIYGNAIWAAREAALDGSRQEHRLWSQPYTIANIIDTLLAVLECPLSPSTQEICESIATKTSDKRPPSGERG